MKRSIWCVLLMAWSAVHAELPLGTTVTFNREVKLSPGDSRLVHITDTNKTCRAPNGFDDCVLDCYLNVLPSRSFRVISTGTRFTVIGYGRDEIEDIDNSSLNRDTKYTKHQIGTTLISLVSTEHPKGDPSKTIELVSVKMWAKQPRWTDDPLLASIVGSETAISDACPITVDTSTAPPPQAF